MRANEIRKAVFRIIEKYTHVKVQSGTLLRSDAGLDSMDQVQICMDLESEFNLTISDDQLFSPEVEQATAGQIADMVTRMLNAQEEQDKESEEETEEEIPQEAMADTGKGADTGNGDCKSIAEEYLISKAKVWCHNRNCWETESLTMLPNGDFVNEKWRLHPRESHTAYVTLDDALEAVRFTLKKVLEDKEWDLEKLKQDAFLAEKLQELSKTQEQIARDSVYNKELKL